MSTETGRAPAAPRRRRLRPAIDWRDPVQAISVGTPLLFLLWKVWDLRWTMDDGFINYRVLDQLFAGHGPVFNAGERVEAFTSPLWLGLLAVLRASLGWVLEVAWLGVIASTILSVAGAALATVGAAHLRRAGGAKGRVWPAGLLVMVALYPMWEFSTGGLETGLAFAWCGTVFWLLARRARGWGTELHGRADRPRLLAVAIGLGPLVRPDMVVHSMAFGVALLALSPPSLGPRLRAVGWALLVPVAYQVVRMGYYASVVPNTALAKLAGSARWGTGVTYLGNLLGPYVLAVPLLALAGLTALDWRRGWHRRPAVVEAAVVAAGLANTLYVVRVGGDYMHARLLLVPLFTVLMPRFVVAIPALTLHPRSPGRAGWSGRAARSDWPGWSCAGLTLAVAGWAVVAVGWLRPPPPRFFSGDLVSDQRPFWVQLAGTAHPVTVADYRRGGRFEEGARARRLSAAGRDIYVVNDNDVGSERQRPDQPVGPGRGVFLALRGLGVNGRAAGVDVHVIDFHGLADPYVARMPVTTRGLTGHEHSLPEAWGDAEAGVIGPSANPQRGIAAQAMVCGELGRLGTAIHGDLTPGRFLANLVSAPALTRLTVPPNARTARARFCRAP